MSTWNTIARSKRVEWRRREGRPDWEAEMYGARAWRQWERWMSDPNTATFRAAEILEAAKYRPFAVRYRSPGEILRLVLGGQAEGQPWIHTYTHGHPREWQPEHSENDDPTAGDE